MKTQGDMRVHAKKRVRRTKGYRYHPDTIEILKAEKKRTGTPIGRLIDKAVASTFKSLSRRLMLIRREKRELATRVVQLTKEEEILMKTMKETYSPERMHRIENEINAMIDEAV